MNIATLPIVASPAGVSSEIVGGLRSDHRNAARRAFALTEESDATRDRYGRYRFGQSVLLARRLVEAGVSLVQVNWSRVDGQTNNGTWDTHRDHCKSLKSFLMPMLDQTYSALLEDLQERGLLEDTLVVWIGEFGHTPRLNSVGGRDHWGNCFSIALAGGGIRGGIVHGESDPHAAFPVSGIVTPADITATIFHCLGFNPETMLHDQTNRPIPLSRGEVIVNLSEYHELLFALREERSFRKAKSDSLRPLYGRSDTSSFKAVSVWLMSRMNSMMEKISVTMQPTNSVTIRIRKSLSSRWRRRAR